MQALATALRLTSRASGCSSSRVIAGEPTTTADPCEGAFDDPSFRHDDEAVLVAAAHDLQFPHARAGDPSSGCGCCLGPGLRRCKPRRGTTSPFRLSRSM